MPTIKKPRLEEYIQTPKWSVKDLEAHFKLPPAKFDAVPSPSRTKSPMGMNKQSNAHGSTKILQYRKHG